MNRYDELKTQILGQILASLLVNEDSKFDLEAAFEISEGITLKILEKGLGKDYVKKAEHEKEIEKKVSGDRRPWPVGSEEN